MKHLGTLIRVDFIQNYSINRLRKKHGPRTSLVPLILTLLTYFSLLVSIIPSVIVVSYIMYINELGQYILDLAMLIGALTVFILTITKIKSVLFQAKDFDLLMNLPLKPRIIVLSKIISLSLINYFYYFIIFIPMALTYGLCYKLSIFYYFKILLVFFCSPLLIIALCGFISYFLILLFKGSKKKPLVRSLVALFFITIIIVIYFLFSFQIIRFNNSNLFEIFETVQTILCFNTLAIKGINFSILSLIFYLLLCFLVFGLFITIVDKTYLQVNIKAKTKSVNRKYQQKSIQIKSQYQTLLLKEAKRFFSSSAYFMNVIIGPILSVILVILTFYSITSLDESLDANSQSFIIPTLLFCACLMLGILPSTSASINLEGKSFWIIKSLPIKINSLFLAKLSFYIFLCTPFILINSIFCFIFIEETIINKILFCLIQFILVAFYSIQGLWINILTPKFDWTNEMKAVKQSAGTIYSVLINMAASFIVFIPAFILMIFEINSLYFVFGASIIVLVVITRILFTHGKKKYLRIQG